MVRGVITAVLAGCLCFLAGCQDEEKPKEVWQDVKLKDLASTPVAPAQANPWETADFDVHVFEIPVENVSRLNRLWPTLESIPLAFKSRHAFAQNGFSAGFGNLGKWEEIVHLIAQAGGHKAVTVRLSQPQGKNETVRVTSLGTRMKVYYNSAQGSVENVEVGPGFYGLRMIASKPAGVVGATDLIVHPVILTLPGGLVVPGRTSEHVEKSFMEMAFRARMNAGDLVVMGPRGDVRYWATVGGMTFSKPEGSMFAEPGKRPAVKPAARVFVFVCKRVRY